MDRAAPAADGPPETDPPAPGADPDNGEDSGVVPPPPDALVDRRIDVAVAAGVAALGIATIVLSGGIREGQIPDPLGAGGLPRVLGIGLVAIGALLMARRLIAWRTTDRLVPGDGGAADEPGHPSSTLRAMAMWAAGFGWAYLIPRIGYLVSTALLTLVTVAGMKVRSPAKLVIVPVVFSLATWILFNRIFGLRFPAGPVDLFFGRLIPRAF